MLDSIYVAMSGLNSFETGLKVISNNSANLNTPGFKSSTLQFADLFYQAGGSHGQGGLGAGVDTLGTTLDFVAGTFSQTGNPLDVAIDGQGLFTLRDDNGGLHYTRAGQFQFNTDGVLIDRTSGRKVVSVSSGSEGTFALDGHYSSAAQATATVAFRGTLAQGQQEFNLGNIPVIDAAGKTHQLSLVADNQAMAIPAVFGEWDLVLKDGDTTVGNGTVKFDPAGNVIASTAKVPFTYTAAGSSMQPLILDFTQATSNVGGDGSSTLTVLSHDGHAAGELTGAAFDETGTLVFSYSNGQTAKGDKLRLARFDTTAGVEAAGGNEYDPKDAAVWHFGAAGDPGFGAIKSQTLELSNVNLSQEFSDLVIMQRGYQASSQVISTANDMLQQLFNMSGNR